VVQLDRLARSVCRLFSVIEQLAKHWCTFPQSARPDRHHNATRHDLTAGAGRCRPALIGERTNAVAARSHGRISGNPGLHAGGPDAIRKVRAGRDAAHLRSGMASWHVAADRKADAPGPALG
jgi:hypothetical protein